MHAGIAVNITSQKEELEKLNATVLRVGVLGVREVVGVVELFGLFGLSGFVELFGLWCASDIFLLRIHILHEFALFFNSLLWSCLLDHFLWFCFLFSLYIYLFLVVSKVLPERGGVRAEIKVNFPEQS